MVPCAQTGAWSRHRHTGQGRHPTRSCAGRRARRTPLPAPPPLCPSPAAWLCQTHSLFPGFPHLNVGWQHTDLRTWGGCCWAVNGIHWWGTQCGPHTASGTFVKQRKGVSGFLICYQLLPPEFRTGVSGCPRGISSSKPLHVSSSHRQRHTEWEPPCHRFCAQGRTQGPEAPSMALGARSPLGMTDVNRWNTTRTLQCYTFKLIGHPCWVQECLYWTATGKIKVLQFHKLGLPLMVAGLGTRSTRGTLTLFLLDHQLLNEFFSFYLYNPPVPSLPLLALAHVYTIPWCYR